MARFGTLGTQYFDSAGDPLAFGYITFYESGSTSTKKDTFADVALTIKNTNPLQLFADGRQPSTFFNGSARAVLFTSDGVQVEVLDPVGGDVQGNAFSDWNPALQYEKGDLVTGRDGNYYVSCENDNIGNDPVDLGKKWSQVEFLGIYNPDKTYNTNDTVKASDGRLYRSLADGNTGNDPTSSPLSWGGTSLQDSSPVQVATSSVFAYENFTYM